jgi:ADP-heptose:LPS heptosyltransferase/GT2 family glycosyltransferase
MVRIDTLIKYYRHFSRLGWETLQAQGITGVMLGLERVIKRILMGNPADYPRARDYSPGLVSVVILTRNRLDLIQPCLEALDRHRSSTYRVEILLGDTGTTEGKILQFYRRAPHRYKNLKIIRCNSHNAARNCNRLIREQAAGQYIVLLSNGALVTGNWLDSLIGPLADTRIGMVGARLLYPDGTIKQAGIEFDDQGRAGPAYAHQPGDFPPANTAASVSAVSLAAAALRHDVYDRFLLSENFGEEARGIDLGFRLAEAGFTVLYNPAAVVYLEAESPRGHGAGNLDKVWVKRKWGANFDSLLARGRQRLPYDPQEYCNAITILRDDGIGDLLMGVCAFQRLRERYPDRKLVLATYQRNIPMMAGFGIFDEFIPIPDGRKLSPLPIPRASQVFNFINMEMEFGPIWGITNEDNKVNRHLIYTRDLGLDQDFTLPAMPAYPAARQQVLQVLNDMGVKVTRKFVVLSLIASNPARSWWEPYYPALIAAIQALGLTPLVLGTVSCPSFQGPGIINLVGKTKSITEYIEAVKLGAYVISTDSSAYHIAALAGIPFLAIFTGGVKPEARINFYWNYEVVEPPAELTCYPCWDEGCKDLSARWRRDPCRLIISPEEVIDKFKRLAARFPVA